MSATRRSIEETIKLAILTAICDAVHEKVPNGQNGVMSIVVQRTY